MSGYFHTEVDQEFGGRGLAGLLVREALTDSIRKNITVVPVSGWQHEREDHGIHHRWE